MSRYGWAYVNELITGSVGTGPVNSVQFNSGSGYLSGTSNFLYDPATNKLTLLGTLTGSSLIISASAISASNYYGITGGGGTPGGSNTAIQFNSGSTFSGSIYLTYDYTNRAVQIGGPTAITTGSLSVSGSTKLGAYGTDNHSVSGTVTLDNALIVRGATNLTGNVKALGQISASSDFITNGNTLAAGNITSTGGIVSASSAINTNGTIFAASNITSNGIVSASGGINTNAGIYSANGITTSGSISSSLEIRTGGALRAIGDVTTSGSLSSSANAYVSGNLYVSGTTNVGAINSTSMVSASSFKGDGFAITGILGSNVNGIGSDWAIQYKNALNGTLTGSSNFIISGSKMIVTGNVSVVGNLSASSLYGDGNNIINIPPPNYANATRVLECFFPSNNALNFSTIPYNTAITKQTGGGAIQGNGAVNYISGIAYGELTTGNTTDSNDSLSTCIKWNSGAENDYFTSSMTPVFTTRIRTDGDITNCAYYLGFRIAANIGAGSTVFTNFTGSGVDHFIGLGYATSSTLTTNGNWYLLIQSASAVTRYDTGVSVAASTKYDISLSWNTGSATAIINGTTVTVTTGSIPNTYLSPNISISTLTNLVKRLFFVGYDVRY